MSTFPANRKLAFGRLYPGELGSLWEVITFNAPRFHFLMSWLTMTETTLSVERWRASNASMQIDMHGAIHADNGLEFDDHIKNLTELGLDDCATVLGRIKVCYVSQGQPGQNHERLEGLLRDFRQRLYDALKRPKFLVLNAREQEFYEPAQSHYGTQVNTSFPSITYEIDEAAKCLALGRSTASAFHSIRCLEAAIRAMSRCLGIPDPTKGADRSWHNALRAFKTEMDRRWPPSGRLSGDGRRFEELHAILSSLQSPYRNATMHLDQKYTDEEARYIFDAVGVLMKKLTSRCDEDGEPKA